MTCGNWTKGGADGSAMVGHHDRAGPMMTSTWATSWNSSHPTLGCNIEKLQQYRWGGSFLLLCSEVERSSGVDECTDTIRPGGPPRMEVP